MVAHNSKTKLFNKLFNYFILLALILTIIRFVGSYVLLKLDSSYAKGTIVKVYYDETMNYEYFVGGKRQVGTFDDRHGRELKKGQSFLVIYSNLLPRISIFLADKPCVYPRYTIDTMKVDKSDITWEKF